ncbi:hypothetical protein BUN20_18775 [Bacteroides fragilis]|nr:hypothetical protein BUN20_18775 [Bacteroides fragilis]
MKKVSNQEPDRRKNGELEPESRGLEQKDPFFSGKEVSIYPKRSKHFRKMLTSFPPYLYMLFKLHLLSRKITLIRTL